MRPEAMNEQQRRRLTIRLFFGMLIAGFIALVFALALPSLPLMLMALALPPLAGMGLLAIISRGRRVGPSRSWPPPGPLI